MTRNWGMVFIPTETSLHVDRAFADAVEDPEFSWKPLSDITFVGVTLKLSRPQGPSANARILVSRNKREGRWHVQHFRGNYVRSQQRDYVEFTLTRRDRKADQRNGRRPEWSQP